MGFSEIAASGGSWKRGHVAYRCLLGNRLWRGHVAADLNDGSDETDDSASGRGQGLYYQPVDCLGLFSGPLNAAAVLP